LGYVINSTRETPSTQTLAKEAARAGARHGEVFVTDFQTSGRGRRDRGWHSMPGRDLTFSAVARIDLEMKHAPLLSLASAVAVHRALEKFFAGRPEEAAIKWPNDVLIDEKKVCGIICECSDAGPMLNYAAIGIGINVNRSSDELPLAGSSGHAGRPSATSLMLLLGRQIDLPELLASALMELDRSVGQLTTERGRSRLLDEYRAKCVTIGRRVKIAADEETFEGTAVGISPDGSVAVESGGSERLFNACDVVHAGML
jgi:BirA family biotin operon repressor/biotin-[acetyl-CoA-carboxylase] ligase